MRIETTMLGARRHAGIGALVLFASFLATTLMYGKEARQVAIEHRGPGGISWDIQIPHASVLLVVAGPDGEVFRQEFVDSPSFTFLGLEGDPLPDGNYNYELRLVPYIDMEVRDELQAIRESGDDAKLRKMMEQYGIPTKAVSYSASFSITGGNLITGGGTEASPMSGSPGQTLNEATADDPAPIPLPDHVINDDLIVDGSACIGFDCVNGEAFGFDTIRLKENNLRIRFQDTSNSASFPTNDWQIAANDTSNGGANKFSIDDIDGGSTPFTLEAGAPSHSLYVDDTGRVGFGTSTPVADQHSKDGNTPTLRLEQDGSSGFQAQTWDIAGNEANFFIRDATNGSSLPFRIAPGAPSNSLTIRGDGNVGIGIAAWNAAAPLHVIGNGGGTLQVERNDGITPNFRFRTTGGGVTQNWLFQNNAQLGVWAIRDETAGNSPFRIYPGGAESTLTLRWGRVGIGTTSPAGKLDVNGSIYQRGGVLHADYVFEPDYKMESIQEHSAFMWKEKHLPAVPRAKKAADGQEVVEIGSQRRGILEELEKAHVYIEQLDGRVIELAGRLIQKDDQIADLQTQLEQLKALVKSMAETDGRMNH